MLFRQDPVSKQYEKNNRLEAIKILFALCNLKNLHSKLFSVGLPDILLKEDLNEFDLIPSELKLPINYETVCKVVVQLAWIFEEHDVANKIIQAKSLETDLSNPTRYAIANALIHAAEAHGGIQLEKDSLFPRFILPESLFNNNAKLKEALKQELKNLDERVKPVSALTPKP